MNSELTNCLFFFVSWSCYEHLSWYCNVFKSINQHMHVGGIFCDWAAPYDCVHHEILLAKLHFYGIW